MAKSFWDRLFDAKDSSVDQLIFFTLIGVVVISICGLIVVTCDQKDFSFDALGGAYTLLFSGSAAHSIGAGIQSKLTPPDQAP